MKTNAEMVFWLLFTRFSSLSMGEIISKELPETADARDDIVATVYFLQNNCQITKK